MTSHDRLAQATRRIDRRATGMKRPPGPRVSLETASPDEIKSGGEGWTLSAGFADTPFGRALSAEGPRGVCRFAFVEPGLESAAWSALQQEWPRARLRREDAAAARLSDRLFRAATPGVPVRAYARGTDFQVRVWRALLRVNPGSLTTYGRLAAALEQPSAARAVGTAVGRNALAYLIPCHRVIRETGVLGGYRWGPARKRAILAWEDVPPNAVPAGRALRPSSGTRRGSLAK